MKIKKINIQNFRGFEKKEVVFPTNMTVIIGNNTAGKTSLLSAMKVGIGAFLQSFKGLPGGKAYRLNFTESDRYRAFDFLKKDYLRNEESTRIEVEAELYETQKKDDGYTLKPVSIKWYRVMTDKGSTEFNEKCAGEIRQMVGNLEEKRDEEGTNTVLPVVLFFGTNRIDKQYRQSKKVKERLTRIAKAYKAALSDNVDFTGAIEWLKRYDKNIRDGKEFEGTREALYEALKKAIPALSEVELDGGELEAIVTVEGRQPERHHYSYMSDGFKSMINMVSEIAYRCIQLNGFLQEKAVSMTPGIVMIDEVDLYLHPSWQQHVLVDLQKAFPNIQFVVTTHSPFIVQSVRGGQLVTFDETANDTGEPYTESIEDIVGTRMGMETRLRSHRFNEMAKVAEDFFKALDSGAENIDELKQRLDLLEAEYSEDPAYVSFIKTQYNTKRREA